MERCNVVGRTKTRNLGVVKERGSTLADLEEAKNRDV